MKFKKVIQCMLLASIIPASSIMVANDNYTFNENVFIENKNYDRGSALVGKNITIEESSIAEGGSLSIKANEKVTLNGTFTCNIGGKLEIK